MLDSSFDAPTEEGMTEEEVRSALADRLGIDSNEFGEVLASLASVRVNRQGNIHDVIARANDPDQLPKSAPTRADHRARINVQFRLAESIERWAFRLVWWPIVISLLYSLL
jgi:hypothetical protein